MINLEEETGDYFLKNIPPKYPQPHNIRIPQDLNTGNPVLEEYMVVKGHGEAKYAARRQAKDRKQDYLEDNP